MSALSVAVVILAILLPLLLAGAFLLGRSLRERPSFGPALSAVTRQHFEIFQSGHVNEAAIESAKLRFQALLERGDVATVEASLRPGMHYVFQVRALAELGTETAGLILERQLQRRLSDDKLEQTWYWIDLAGGLRILHREESLPQLLRCAESALDQPLGHFFAAETICFLGFPGYLRRPNAPIGRSALRVLHRAVEGLRYGVQPVLVTESRLGEMMEDLWEEASPGQPLLVRLALETCRFLRRVPHARRLLGEERGEQEAFDWQVHRLEALEETLYDYLNDAPPALLRRLDSDTTADVLLAMQDLRVEAADQVLPRLERWPAHLRELGIGVLTWSRDSRVGPWLRDQAQRRVPMAKRARKRRRVVPPRQPSLPPDVPYRALLSALRGHPGRQTETFLAQAAHDWDPTYRVAALGSLGWWEPLDRRLVLTCLEEGRRDPCFEVRQAARAALARLGERQALHWFRQGLSSEDPHFVHDAIQVIAAENLFLLWPDLDRLADSDHAELAHHAREALERLSEDLTRP